MLNVFSTWGLNDSENLRQTVNRIKGMQKREKKQTHRLNESGRKAMLTTYLSLCLKKISGESNCTWNELKSACCCFAVFGWLISTGTFTYTICPSVSSSSLKFPWACRRTNWKLLLRTCCSIGPELYTWFIYSVWGWVNTHYVCIGVFRMTFYCLLLKRRLHEQVLQTKKKVL